MSNTKSPDSAGKDDVDVDDVDAADIDTSEQETIPSMRGMRIVALVGAVVLVLDQITKI